MRLNNKNWNQRLEKPKKSPLCCPPSNPSKLSKGDASVDRIIIYFIHKQLLWLYGKYTNICRGQSLYLIFHRNLDRRISPESIDIKNKTLSKLIILNGNFSTQAPFEYCFIDQPCLESLIAHMPANMSQICPLPSTCSLLPSSCNHS